MPLAGARYIQDSDPGAVGFGYEWAKPSTGELYARNTSNTAWVLVGILDNANLGNIPLSGGAATGALTGATGLAPTSSPDFTTSAKRDGVNLARMTDLTDLATTLRAEFASIASSLVSSQVPSSLTAANLAVGGGSQSFSGTAISNQSVTIPLPIFSDGTTATDAQVLFHRMWPASFGLSDRATSPSTSISVRAVLGSGRQYNVTCNNTQSDSFDITVGWIIIAAR